jgi:hypothetical protein
VRSNPVTLSPVALIARLSPTTMLDANTRVEYDVSGTASSRSSGRRSRRAQVHVDDPEFTAGSNLTTDRQNRRVS